MKWERKNFSNYTRWQFDIKHGGCPVSIVVKEYRRKFRSNYFEIQWDSPKNKSVRWEIRPVDYDKTEKYGKSQHVARSEMFKRLRQSLNYGLNIKGRAVVDRLMGANGQSIFHIKKQISGKYYGP